MLHYRLVMPKVLPDATWRPKLILVHFQTNKIVNNFRTPRDTGKMSTEHKKETNAALLIGDVSSVSPHHVAAKTTSAQFSNEENRQ
jgi:hypothetical protein